jgi:hypothetical protein
MIHGKCSISGDPTNFEGSWEIKFVNGYLRRVCKTCGFVDDRKTWIEIDNKKFYTGDPEKNPQESKRYNLVERLCLKIKLKRNHNKMW